MVAEYINKGIAEGLNIPSNEMETNCGAARPMVACLSKNLCHKYSRNETLCSDKFLKACIPQ